MIDDLDGDNHSAPNPQPFWKCQYRYQFKATAYHEGQISQTIQQCTYLAFTSEFSGEIAICHIAEATYEIEDPKDNASDIEKQKANGSYEPKYRNNVGQMLHKRVLSLSLKAHKSIVSYPL